MISTITLFDVAWTVTLTESDNDKKKFEFTANERGTSLVSPKEPAGVQLVPSGFTKPCVNMVPSELRVIFSVFWMKNGATM